MPDFDYERWWSLHLRLATGKQLTDDENTEYEHGLQRLEQEESQINAEPLENLRLPRAAIERAQTLHTELLMKSGELEQNILQMEAAFQLTTGQSLSLGSHA